jgi:hypothetical protein
VLGLKAPEGVSEGEQMLLSAESGRRRAGLAQRVLLAVATV